MPRRIEMNIRKLVKEKLKGIESGSVHIKGFDPMYGGVEVEAHLKKGYSPIEGRVFLWDLPDYIEYEDAYVKACFTFKDGSIHKLEEGGFIRIM
jgi:hypothetical protein